VSSTEPTQLELPLVWTCPEWLMEKVPYGTFIEVLQSPCGSIRIGGERKPWLRPPDYTIPRIGKREVKK